jgi:hypothetical protein
MACPPFLVSNCYKISCTATFAENAALHKVFPTYWEHVPGKKVSRWRERKNSDFAAQRVGFDRKESPVHNYAYVTPVEG